MEDPRKTVIAAIIDKINDKAGGILVLGVIAVVAMSIGFENANSIVSNIVSGILGLVTGGAIAAKKGG